ALVMSLDRLATGGLKPDLTILFDLDAEAGLARNRGVNKTDRIELEDIAFHKRVREGYLAIAKTDPDRVSIVDAALPAEEVHAKVWGIVSKRLKYGAEGYSRAGKGAKNLIRHAEEGQSSCGPAVLR